MTPRCEGEYDLCYLKFYIAELLFIYDINSIIPK